MATKGMSTAGMTLGYVVASGSAIPSTGSLTLVPEIKTMPNLNPSPGTIDVTPIAESEFHLYTEGLKDIGILEFNANCTDELLTLWNTTLPAAISGGAEGTVCWFCIAHPGITQAIWFQGVPSKAYQNESTVGAALETTLYVTPKSAPQYGAKLA